MERPSFLSEKSVFKKNHEKLGRKKPRTVWKIPKIKLVDTVQVLQFK